MRGWIALALMVVCGGCAVDTDGEIAPDSAERFVGSWFVEETEAHALYAASSYQLHQDGSVELIWDAGWYQVPQGYVLSPDLSVQCLFGAEWMSWSDDRLLIVGNCSDDMERLIDLAFVSDPSGNAAGATVDIQEVGGEAGWLPPQWGWSFRKCAPFDSCRGD